MAVTSATPFRELGDTTLEAFRAELASLDSPMTEDADFIYDAVRGWTLLYLFHAFVEKRYDTVFEQLPPAARNALALRPRDYPEEIGELNGYATFARYGDDGRAMIRRFSDPNLPYIGLTTLEEEVTAYCGVTDVDPDTGVACDPDEYLAVGLGRINELPRIAGEVTGQRIVVVAGHRSTEDEGSAEEKARTDDMARAYRDALRAAGHNVWWLQENDGDADPDDVIGDLDTVGSRTRDLCASVDAKIMLDLHFEGHPNPNVRGLFAVVPDDAGLVTDVAGGAPPDDTWANNTKDRALATAITTRLSERTGIPKRGGLVEPGLMSETQTFVGLGCGGDCAPSRLAMFAYTAGRRHGMVRLVIEHGALTNAQDRAIIDAPGFFDRAAAGAVAAVADLFGAPVPTGTATDPGTVFVPLAPPNLGPWDGKERILGQALIWACRRTFTARMPTPVFRFADRTSGEVRAPFPIGHEYQSDYWFEFNGEPWILMADGARVPVKDSTPFVEFRLD